MKRQKIFNMVLVVVVVIIFALLFFILTSNNQHNCLIDTEECYCSLSRPIGCGNLNPKTRNNYTEYVLYNQSFSDDCKDLYCEFELYDYRYDDFTSFFVIKIENVGTKICKQKYIC